jgi:hypothetical protein
MKVFFAIILGLIGLLMSSCGLLFLTLSGGVAGIAVIAVPSLAAGALLIWGASTLWKSGKGSPAAASLPSEPK